MAIIQSSGLLFPLELSSGRHLIVSGVDLIQASIKTILAWPLFTRYFNGNFGSRTHEVVEEPNDDILITLVRRFVIDSITTWEKRVELISLSIIRPTPDKLVIDLSYLIKDTNVEDSFYYNYNLS